MQQIPSVWFTSATLQGIKLVITKRFVYAIAEWPPDQFFEELAPLPPFPGTIEGTVVGDVFKETWDLSKEIVIAGAAGLIVDDDNEPAQEHIPAPNLFHDLDPNAGLNKGQ